MILSCPTKSSKREGRKRDVEAAIVFVARVGLDQLIRALGHAASSVVTPGQPRALRAGALRRACLRPWVESSARAVLGLEGLEAHLHQRAVHRGQRRR